MNNHISWQLKKNCSEITYRREKKARQNFFISNLYLYYQCLYCKKILCKILIQTVNQNDDIFIYILKCFWLFFTLKWLKFSWCIHDIYNTIWWRHHDITTVSLYKLKDKQKLCTNHINTYIGEPKTALT